MKKANPPTEPRPRGRPRGYDPETALNAAMNVFWARGYAEASLEDLTQAMEVTRPTLYAAFGDKEALFLAAVAHYEAFVRPRFAASLSKPDLRTALIALFDEAVARYTNPAPHARGCMLASAVLSDAPLTPRAQEAVQASLRNIERDFVTRFTQARWSINGLAPLASVRLVATFVFGISARARLGAPAKMLTADANTFIDAMLGEA